MKKWGRAIAVCAAAWLMTLAVALDMSVVPKAKPDATDLWGIVYQFAARTTGSLTMDGFVITLLFALTALLCHKLLFARSGGVGEYLLSGFFGLSGLICNTMRSCGSLAAIWENVFQLVKAAIVFGGWALIGLMGLRAIHWLLHHPFRGALPGLWIRHPFAFPVAALTVLWLPLIIIRFPGVIHLDVVMPIRQYIGLDARANDFPAVGTLIYGLAYSFGQKTGNLNNGYFLLYLFQLASFVLVQGYLLWVMNRLRVPSVILLGTLALFVFSPIYGAWVTTLGKDACYMVWCMLLTGLLMEFYADKDAFLARKSRLLLLAQCVVCLWLTRYNGKYIVAAAAVCMLAALRKKQAFLRCALPFVCAVVVSMGLNAVVIRALNMEELKFYDFLSLPFQQTARVASLHEEEIPQEERDIISTMIDFDRLAELYQPDRADSVKTTVSVQQRSKADAGAYLRVWLSQMKRYPLDYADAFFNMNYFMFDLQSNVPTYHSYADIERYTYPYAFHETAFFNLEQIRPLLSAQLAFTQSAFDFDTVPVIGQFASMGFCSWMMIAMLYLGRGRKGFFSVMLPSLMTAVMCMFCPEVYIRYLLPTMACLPLWFGGFFALEGKADEKGELPCSALK